MTAEAAMKYLGELDGKKCYWAAPDTFTTPGFYYWDGENNVHVPLPKRVVLSKRPTIAELEAILDSKGSDVVIEILPNGEVRATERESVSRPTRYEVIDHRKAAPEVGRVNPKCVEFSYQDEGRTLKVFLSDSNEIEGGE